MEGNIEKIYDEFSVEELKRMLKVAHEQNTSMECIVKNLKRSNEILENESNKQQQRINELTSKVDKLEKENEERASEKELDSEEEDEENDFLGFDRWCEENKELAEEVAALGAVSPYKRRLYQETKDFLEETSFTEFVSEISKMVIGQPEINLVLLSLYQYLQAIIREKCQLTNPPARILLTAPSGNGKTHLLRCLQKFFSIRIPSLKFYHVDMSCLTSASFKGRNVESILSGVDEGLGSIIWGSEMDKLITPRYDGKGVNIHQEVQSELLQIFEGQEVRYAKDVIVNTNEIMFIMDGSFQNVRDNKLQMVNKQCIGFVENKEEYDIFNRITRQDILNAGCLHELCGRFTFIANLYKLSDEAVHRIIMGYQERISEELSIELVLSDEYVVSIIEEANGSMGCRVLYSKMYEETLRGVLAAYEAGICNHPTIVLHNHGYDVIETELHKEDTAISEEVVADETPNNE